ncbi:MAG: ion transporter [Candidatus Competibacterales bacterium]
MNSETRTLGERLREMVNHPTASITSRWFHGGVLVIIVYSIVTLSVETLPDLPPETRAFLAVSNGVVAALFVAEYALRLYCAPVRWRYVVSFYGLVDLLVIVSLCLAAIVDVRGLRALRLLVLVRLLKLVRYIRAIDRFKRALLDIKEELVLFYSVMLLVLYLSASGIYFFEHHAQPEVFASIFHSLWWAVITLTTVGYGDVHPITPGGQAFTCLVLLLGLAIVAVPAGLLAAALANTR